MHTHLIRAAFATLALLALSACGNTSGPDAASTSSTSAVATSESAESSHPTTEASPNGSTTSAEAGTNTSANDLSLDSISIDITDAQKAELRQTTGRTLAGTTGVQVKLNIANASETAIDAATLSFPSLALDDGTEITGFALTSEGHETTFGIIEPGASEELTVFFPTEQIPNTLSITLLNPHNPGQTLTIETDF